MKKIMFLWLASLIFITQSVCAQPYTANKSGVEVSYVVVMENHKPTAVIQKLENNSGKPLTITVGNTKRNCGVGECKDFRNVHCSKISSEFGTVLSNEEIKDKWERFQASKESSSSDNVSPQKNEPSSRSNERTEPVKEKESTNNKTGGGKDERPSIRDDRPANTSGNHQETDQFVWDDDSNPTYEETEDSPKNREEQFDEPQEDSVQEKEQNVQGGIWKTLAYILAAILLLMLALWLWNVMKKKLHEKDSNRRHREDEKKKDKKQAPVLIPYSGQNGNKGRTRPQMKDFNIGDVIDNDAYMRVDISECCEQSTIYQMYVKNDCIKEIYNLYARDLSKDSGRLENGCFVVGRWAYHQERQQFIVTLEKVVLPGDDAVFKEYELNFGGKIKMNLYSLLRRLRKETKLQYDLTCWVHSHPGLGVFFSNEDLGVQRQIIDPEYPHILTAIVVDILTPGQELGIFTFKPDGASVKVPTKDEGTVVRTNVGETMPMNSREDLKKLYSLEEWYRWAVQSEQNRRVLGETYDIIGQEVRHVDNCHAIRLTDGAVVDVRQMRSEMSEGMMGYVMGFKKTKGKDTDYFVEHVYNYRIPDMEVLGYFVKVSHISIPTVRRVIEKEKDRKNVTFVLVYSTSDDSLTTIHLSDGELLAAEEPQQNLKFQLLDQWNKRRR